jgi:hypothetical protein
MIIVQGRFDNVDMKRTPYFAGTPRFTRSFDSVLGLSSNGARTIEALALTQLSKPCQETLLNLISHATNMDIGALIPFKRNKGRVEISRFLMHVASACKRKVVHARV